MNISCLSGIFINLKFTEEENIKKDVSCILKINQSNMYKEINEVLLSLEF